MAITDNEAIKTVRDELIRFWDGVTLPRAKQVFASGLHAFGYENASHLDHKTVIDSYHDGQWDYRLFETGASKGEFHYVFDDGTRWEFTDGLMFFAMIEEYEDTDEDRALDAELAAEQRAEQRMEAVCGAYMSGGYGAAVQALSDFDSPPRDPDYYYRQAERMYDDHYGYDD